MLDSPPAAGQADLVTLIAGTETVVWIFTLLTPSSFACCLRSEEGHICSIRLQRFSGTAHLAAGD
jgi:hypothetical protein